MTLAPNHRQLLNGNNPLLLLVAMFLFSSCELFKPAQQSPGKADPAEKKPAQERTLDEVPGRKIYDPETRSYRVVTTAPAESMDTIRWKDAVVDPKQIIRSGGAASIPEDRPKRPEVLQSKDITPEVRSELLSSYNVAVVLPFLSDRFSATANALPPNSDWALNFYGGVKMALEDLKSEGVNLSVSVIDGRETSETAARQLINSNPDLQKAHVIIGPYRRETAIMLADFAQRFSNNDDVRDDKVILSPYTTATDVTANNPNYVQVNPSLQTHCEAIMRHVRQRYRPEQVVLVCRDRDQEVERLRFFQNENARLSGGVGVSRLREFVVPDNANINNADLLSLIRFSDTTVFVMPTWASETFVVSFLRRLDMARRNNTAIVVYGMPQWMTYETVDFEYYERLNVHVSSSSFIDPFTPDVQFFRRRFFDRYGAIPKEEAYLGYDVMRYCGRMLKKYGTKFQYTLEQESSQMLHTRFEFERIVIPTTTGADRNPAIQRFENKYVNILRFRDYYFKLAE